MVLRAWYGANIVWHEVKYSGDRGCRQVVKGQRQVEVSAILECGGLAPLWHAPTRSI